MVSKVQQTDVVQRILIHSSINVAIKQIVNVALR